MQVDRNLNLKVELGNMQACWAHTEGMGLKIARACRQDSRTAKASRTCLLLGYLASTRMHLQLQLSQQLPAC